MLTEARRSPRIRWTTYRSTSGALTLTVTLRPRRSRGSTMQLSDATTPALLIAGLREAGLSLADIGKTVGALRHRVLEWQRGVVGVGMTRWARLTALRDVVVALDDHGKHKPRAWLFAYNSLLDACPYQRIAADDFTPVIDAARRAARPRTI